MSHSSHYQLNVPPHRPINGARYLHGQPSPLKRSRSPNPAADGSRPAEDKDQDAVDERRNTLMRDLYARSERMILKLFDKRCKSNDPMDVDVARNPSQNPRPDPSNPSSALQAKKPARAINEDDYGDDDEDDDEPCASNLGIQAKTSTPNILDRLAAKPLAPPTSNLSPDRRAPGTSQDQTKSSEDVRKKLEEDRRTDEAAAKENFLKTFCLLENDRDAMLDQQKLDELDRQVETEMSGVGTGDTSANGHQREAEASLSNANLGASSLTLKHLIARIDAKRNLVHASDAQLRNLMTEVRKNRSKWASEDRVGQEELYEPAERVLMELKGMTEYSQPFLSRVPKRDAPDYYKVILHPMDISSMIKKLKQLSYGSKKEFVEDLDLMWTNCFKYNTDSAHPIRKKGEHLKKVSARLIPLIPDIVVRNRSDVDAEERAQRQAEEDSDDDDEPIVATRGRKAPSKKSKKGVVSARKAPPALDDSNSAPDARPPNSSLGSLGAAASLRNEHSRTDADSNADGSQFGTATPPPPGNTTPLGTNSGIDGGGGSHADASEFECIHGSLQGVTADQNEEPGDEDEEYKIWKQVTKKDRALFAAERHRLFQTDRINGEEPAMLRNRTKMRRWMRQQKFLMGDEEQGEMQIDSENTEAPQPVPGSSLAEGMDVDDDCTLPDYYDPVAGVPHINERLQWTEDAEGQVVDRREECLRKVPDGYFTAPESALTSKIEGNMRQMQETRKVMAKIGVVKQMQLQAQTYQNQFQKYDPEPFHEADINPTVVSDDGPVMAPWVARAALQRSVGKMFYHAGFEDYQPSTLDAVTDVAGKYLRDLGRTLGIYSEAHKIPASAKSALEETSTDSPQQSKFKPRFSAEEAVLHTLLENGTDLDQLTSYIEEDVSRLSSKLSTHHEHVKTYLAELLRPALDPSQAGNDGAGAFTDGNESQFVAGDFAEDIDEDFFGFKELGLDREFGLASLSVPLHLLQSRMNNVYQPANAAAAGSSVGNIMENPPPWDSVTKENIPHQIGLVQPFFEEKLKKSGGKPLTEDEELPAKQRFPKPRLPPNGKISSPRKRPIREQQMMARKKRRMEIEKERAREREESGALDRGASVTSTAAGGEAATQAMTSDVSMADSNPGNVAHLNGETEAGAKATTMTNEDSAADQAKKLNQEIAPLLNGNTPRMNGDVPKKFAEKDSSGQNSSALQLDPPSSKDNAEKAKNVDPEKPRQPQQTQSTNKTNDQNDGKGNGKGSGDSNGNDTGMLSPESLKTIAAH